MNFSVPEPVTPAEAEILQLHGGRLVSRCAIQDALAQGAITVDEANEAIASLKENFDRLIGQRASKLL